MFNPLVDKFDTLSDAELESKVNELGRKYWQTQNLDLKAQIGTLLEMYREELRSRRERLYQKINKNDDSDLDSLINIQ